MVQVTAVLAAFSTVALNCCVWLAPKLAETGAMVTVISEMRVTNPSVPPPPNAVWKEPEARRSVDEVVPAIYALPAPSSAMPRPKSSALPPRQVEYMGAAPFGLNFTMNAS